MVEFREISGLPREISCNLQHFEKRNKTLKKNSYRNFTKFRGKKHDVLRNEKKFRKLPYTFLHFPLNLLIYFI